MKKKHLFAVAMLTMFSLAANAQTEKTGLKFDIQETEKKEKVESITSSHAQKPVAPTISSTINKSEVFFSRAETKGNDVEILCGINPRINGTRMEAMSVKYEMNGKLTSKQSRVTGYGGKTLPRDGNVLNRGNRVNHGETFYVTATIKNVAYLHSLKVVYIHVWTSYGEGDLVLRNVTW